MNRSANVLYVALVMHMYSTAWCASFQGLGCQSCVAENVSADGSTVVGFRSGDLGFRWTVDEGLDDVPDLPSGEIRSSPKGVSADGRFIAGGSNSGLGGEAFRWDSSETINAGLGQGGTFAWDISDDGSVVAGFARNGSRPMRWTEEDGVQLLADREGIARGISGDGSTIVGISDGSFRWTDADGLQLVGPGSARAVSYDGSVVVGVSSGQAFRWTEETGMVLLGGLPGQRVLSEAYDVTPDGTMVVGWAATELFETAMVWDEVRGMRNLNVVLTDLGVDLTGWHLSSVRAVSADGLTVVGSGRNPSGVSEAWVAVIPEPDSAFLLLLAALFSPAIRSRRR